MAVDFLTPKPVATSIEVAAGSRFNQTGLTNPPPREYFDRLVPILETRCAQDICDFAAAGVFDVTCDGTCDSSHQLEDDDLGAPDF
jgi:hypothetical protein